MEFTITQTFRGDLATVVKTVLDPKILPILQQRMETIIEIEGLECVREGNLLKRRVRYLPKPLIRSVGVKKIEPKSMEWIEVSTFDETTLEGTFENRPTSRKLAGMLTNHGRLKFEMLPDGQVRRTVSGTLEIKVSIFLRPFVPIALHLIEKNAEKILSDEARVVQAVIDAGGLPA